MSHCRVFILVAAVFLLAGSCTAVVSKEEAPAADAPAPDAPAGETRRVKREVASAPGVCNRPTQLTAEQIKQALDKHNNARSTAGNSDPNDSTASDAANMPPMVWDDGLASRAQDWADSCSWAHANMTECDGKTSTGQSIYRKYSVSNIDPATYDVATDFVKKWADEKQFYDIATKECKDATGASKSCGHYTQIVWAKTTRVGCGISYCPTVAHRSTKDNIMFACNYSPSGNYNGATPYIVGAPCSKCQDDNSIGGWLCNDNLCETCTPDGNANCNCNTLECLNGGTWDAGKCECRCPADYFGNKCERACACTDNKTWCNMHVEKCGDPWYAAWLTTICEGTCKEELCVRPPSCPAA